MRLLPHARLTAVNPQIAVRADVGTCAFRRHQGFFYM
jgi:hypothetical protein